MQRFRAEIHKVGINPCVDVPKDIVESLLKQAGKKAGAVPVRGKLNKAKFQTAIVKFKGKWRLYLNAAMRTQSGTDSGDSVSVGIEFDPEPTPYPMPKELVRALKQNTKAKHSFEKLTPSRQKEIIRYLSSLKTVEALKRNIKKLIDGIL